VTPVGTKVQVEIAEVDPRGKLSLVPVLSGEGGSDSSAAGNGGGSEPAVAAD